MHLLISQQCGVSRYGPGLALFERTALESVEEPGVASCRRVVDNKMGTVVEQTPYQCDQCGGTNVVAAPVIYQQGTHTYSTRFSSGTTQSSSAHAAAPPDPRSYKRPILFWGLPL